ncbi:MAG: hypothetical protein ACOYOU_04250 [Kiritimatiellia bacterium]
MLKFARGDPLSVVICGLQDAQTASLWLPVNTSSATKTRFGGDLDVSPGFCHASPMERLAGGK